MELLSPVGNFECLKAAVQNGADSVYFGAGSFNARAFADNFDLDNLREAIFYAKSRGVKTNLTLNTLIKDDEFDNAFDLAKKAYEYGIDAIIVQDLGLATTLIEAFPDLAIHASTQMSVHNLEGVLKLQKLGFKRVVLSRELSIEEIDYICKHSDIEIECFIHGALCISYSGQCLFSSLVGGRSGNRGKCAQPCRLPYELYDNNSKINNGYLLSTRDVCGLSFIPQLLNSGVSCFKIEGRMKSPEYVATVTRIYRKYIDLAKSSSEYLIDEKDKKDLLQVFNRGNFSNGHLNDLNKDLVFKDKQNNMGILLGTVEKYNKNKGYITLSLKEKLSIGDGISLQNESGTYNVSELMINNSNIKSGNIGQFVTIGRMKGNIHLQDKIYKISSKELDLLADNSFNKDYKKILLNCTININIGKPVTINITSANDLELYKDLNINYTLENVIPTIAENKPLSKDIIIEQISKTNNTKYSFKEISINLDDNLFLPKFSSSLNELRRTSLEQVDNYIAQKIFRQSPSTFSKSIDMYNKTIEKSNQKKYSLLLNKLNASFNYTNLESVDCIYIPLKFFINPNYINILKDISQSFNTYIYMPTVIRKNYQKIIYNSLKKVIKDYNIKGIVVSNISNFEILNTLNISDLDIVSNYTLNVYNNYTASKLISYGANRITISPELDKYTIQNLISSNLQTEIIAYGNIPLMNMNYCLLGESNKCYTECKHKCYRLDSNFYLKDRLGFRFEIVPDNIDTVTTLYNSKTTFINSNDFQANYMRVDILNESIDEINTVIRCVKSGNKLEGNNYTNGNLNREI